MIIDAILALVGEQFGGAQLRIRALSQPLRNLLNRSWSFFPDASLRAADLPTVAAKRYARTMADCVAGEAADDNRLQLLRKRILLSIAEAAEDGEPNVDDLMARGVVCLPPFTALGTPFMSARKYVEWQLARYPSKQPDSPSVNFTFCDYLCPGVFEECAIPVPKCGLLGDIQSASETLCCEFGWRLSEANTFVLNGVPPAYNPAEWGFVEVPRIPARSRIVLVLDPELSVHEVASVYAAARSAVIRRKDQGAKHKTRARRLNASSADFVSRLSGAWNAEALAIRLASPIDEFSSLSPIERQKWRELHNALLNPRYRSIDKGGGSKDLCEAARARNSEAIDWIDLRLVEQGSSHHELTKISWANLHPNPLWTSLLLAQFADNVAAWSELAHALELKDLDRLIGVATQLRLITEDHGAQLRSLGCIDDTQACDNLLAILDLSAQRAGFESLDQFLKLGASFRNVP